MATTDTDGDTIAQLAVVVLLLMLAVPTLATAHELAGTPIEYEEQVQIDYQNKSVVSQSSTVEGYSDNITVVDNGTVLQQDEDYRWNQSTGVINWENTQNSEDGDVVRVEYAAYQRTAETETAWLIIAPFMGLFGLFSLVSAIRVLWSYTAEVFDA